MVRKLVVVENSPGEGRFPYSIFWTDFSSKRAEPLKVTTLFAATDERARQLSEKLIAENITKGFVLTGESSTGGAVPSSEASTPKPEAPAPAEAAAEAQPAAKKKAAKKAK